MRSSTVPSASTTSTPEQVLAHVAVAQDARARRRWWRPCRPRWDRRRGRWGTCRPVLGRAPRRAGSAARRRPRPPCGPRGRSRACGTGAPGSARASRRSASGVEAPTRPVFAPWGTTRMRLRGGEGQDARDLLGAARPDHGQRGAAAVAPALLVAGQLVRLGDHRALAQQRRRAAARPPRGPCRSRARLLRHLLEDSARATARRLEADGSNEASPRRAASAAAPRPAAARKREAIRHLKEAAGRGPPPPPLPAHRERAATSGSRAWRRSCAGASRRRRRTALTELIWAAERSPVIFKLENWILDQSFQAAAGWKDAGLAGVRVNVNLSAREFPRADLVGRVTPAARGRAASTRATSAWRSPRPAACGDSTRSRSRSSSSSDHGHRAVARRLRHRPLVPGVAQPPAAARGEDPGHLRGAAPRRRSAARPSSRASSTSPTTSACASSRRRWRPPAQRDFLAERGCDLFQGFLFYAAHARGGAAGGAGRPRRA